MDDAEFIEHLRMLRRGASRSVRSHERRAADHQEIANESRELHGHLTKLLSQVAPNTADGPLDFRPPFENPEATR